MLTVYTFMSVLMAKLYVVRMTDDIILNSLWFISILLQFPFEEVFLVTGYLLPLCK